MRDKTSWPTDLQVYEFGNDARLFLDFEYGEIENGKFRSEHNWLELDTIRNVDVSSSSTKGDVTSRRSYLFKESYPGMSELSVSVEALFDNTDVVCASLQRLHTDKAFALVGVFTEKGAGPVFFAHLPQLTRKEGVGDLVSLSVTFECAKFIRWFDSTTTEPIVDYDGRELYHPLGIESEPTGPTPV